MSGGVLAGLTETPPCRVLTLGPGCRLWVQRPPRDGVTTMPTTTTDPQVQAARFGQQVIVRWEGLRLSGPLRRWRPAMRQDGRLPFSAQNAGLLYIRASTVRAAVDACLAEWSAEL